MSSSSLTLKRKLQNRSVMATDTGLKKDSACKHAYIAPLDADRVIFTATSTPRIVPPAGSPEVSSLSFCTDHMITVNWTAFRGWDVPELKPYGPLNLMPTASVLHYAVECFEGMKVYRGFDGKLRLFRPRDNCRRMLMSSDCVALPSFAPEQLEQLIKMLIAVDGEKWLPPSASGMFLYIRPTHIATFPALGLQKPLESMLFVIACLFPRMDDVRKPLTLENSQASHGLQLLASKEMVRAWPGGFGHAKIGANYGPTLGYQEHARWHGFDQIIYLTGSDFRIGEVSTANLFVVWQTAEGCVQLVTPILDGMILPGITRDSVLQLARSHLATGNISGLAAIETVESVLTMGDLIRAHESGRLIEAFVTGTAMFITTVGRIHFSGLDIHLPPPCGYASVLKSWLSDIMWGKVPHEWAVEVEEAHLKGVLAQQK